MNADCAFNFIILFYLHYSKVSKIENLEVGTLFIMEFLYTLVYISKLFPGSFYASI